MRELIELYRRVVAAVKSGDVKELMLVAAQILTVLSGLMGDEATVLSGDDRTALERVGEELAACHSDLVAQPAAAGIGNRIIIGLILKALQELLGEFLKR